MSKDDSKEILYIVTEYCEAGALNRLIAPTNEAFTPAMMSSVASQLFSAVTYLHSIGIAHKGAETTVFMIMMMI